MATVPADGGVIDVVIVVSVIVVHGPSHGFGRVSQGLVVKEEPGVHVFWFAN